jgi:hypothetical protein
MQGKIEIDHLARKRKRGKEELFVRNRIYRFLAIRIDIEIQQ